MKNRLFSLEAFIFCVLFLMALFVKDFGVAYYYVLHRDSLSKLTAGHCIGLLAFQSVD
jgi:hypothetical protein